MLEQGFVKLSLGKDLDKAKVNMGEGPGSPPAHPDVMIQVKDLAYIYGKGHPGETTGLAGVSLEIRRGEYVAVAGPNGSGKSTLARHFNALLLPSGGQVLVDGLDTSLPENVWEIRRRVGMVFQNPDNQIVSTDRKSVV